MDESRTPFGLSRWDLLAAGAMAGLVAAWTLFADRLPARVPTHFDFAGQPNGWTPRGAMPWLIFGLPALVWLLHWLVDLARLGADEVAKRKMLGIRPLRGLMTLGMVGLSLAILLIPLYGLWILWIALGFLFLCLGIGIWESLLRLRREVPREERERYVMGLFYVNSEDERIWIPKLIGVGWTLNFGRPAGWLMLVLLLSPLLLILALR